MNNREKKQTKQNGERKDRRSDQSKWRSTREQAVFLYFLIVFILVSIHLDRGNAPDKLS